VNGSVVLNVLPGLGPNNAYGEQVEFTAIAGASSTNTITINGNGQTLTFAPTTNARHLLKFNGTQWMTINNLNIVGTSVDFGWGIHLINAANHNTITNCMIDLSAVVSTSTTQSAGIVATNSSTSTSAAGNNANYCTFSGNRAVPGDPFEWQHRRGAGSR
jgi:hypothetical protein